MTKWWILAAALIFAFVGFSFLPKPAPHTYATKICDGAFEKNYDFRTDTEHNHFDIPLREGCFDAFVMLPRSWHDWNVQPTGDQNGFWIAYWHDGSAAPRGPFGPNDRYNFANMTTVFRLQGHGTARFSTNKAVDK